MTTNDTGLLAHLSLKLVVAGDGDMARAKSPIYHYDTRQMRTKIGQVAFKHAATASARCSVFEADMEFRF
jgi:hypothetical protein